MEHAPHQPKHCTELFVAFTLLALQGFGGVLAVSQRVLCDQRQWLTRQEFVEIFALGQLLPGPNICNMSLIIGDRFFGWRGAAAALGGMMLLPLALALALTQLYVQFAHVPLVAGALKGMGIVAAGMIFGTAFKLASTLKVNVLGLIVCIGFIAITFVGVGVLRYPLVWVLFSVGGAACVWAWTKVGGPVER
jgi:chromate transporter